MSGPTFLRQMQQQEFDALVAEYAVANGLDVVRAIRGAAHYIPAGSIREMERKSGHHYGEHERPAHGGDS